MNNLGFTNETERLDAFPVCKNSVFLAHAGVTALPAAVARAMADYAWESATQQQEFAAALRMAAETRSLAAKMIGARSEEIALLGPTSLGLSMVALGLDWRAGDEIICHKEDYPANVYPWMDLARKQVKVKFVKTDGPGEITPEAVEAAMTPRTRLVALASCHFLTGRRLDVDGVGRVAHKHGALFCLDAIQTVGAFPTLVDHVDFLSADAHKWMLGPMAIGVVFVKKSRFDQLHPALLGAANVRSPNYIVQDAVEFPEHASRYEPGVLNMSGVAGMKAALELLHQVSIETVSKIILHLKSVLVAGLRERDYKILGPAEGPWASGITTFHRPGVDMQATWDRLQAGGIAASIRHDRSGTSFIRLSPHFYNTEAEMERVLALL